MPTSEVSRCRQRRSRGEYRAGARRTLRSPPATLDDLRAPHFPSENVERFVRRVVDVQHSGEFGRMYELHRGERVPRLATHALDERQCAQEPDRFGIVIRECVERRCG